ncbi:MFS transporter [Atopococcus tabaci]|uniref:MFS transporter n=1 Tax=Atopococcus tabaci TaxID=269774 RepID=UPI0003F68191|nr:MFS transporter [Atopococcus tabaci]
MEKKKIFYDWWIVLGAIIVLGTTGPAAVAVANIFQSSVTAEFGISNSQFALTNSIVLGVGIFLSPFISQKLAYGNFKRTFVIGVLLYALGYAGYGLAPNIWVIYFLSLLIGIGNTACIIIPTGILINNWFVKKRGLAMSLALTGLGFGGAILSPLLTGLIESIGWRQTYLVYGTVMLAVGLFVVMFVFKPRPEDIGLKPYGVEEASDLPAGAQKSGENQEQTQGVPMSVSETMTKPFFILLIVGGVFAGIMNNGGFGQFPPVLQNVHGAGTAVTIVSLYSAIGIAGKVILGN